MLLVLVAALSMSAPQTAIDYWSQATSDYDADRYEAAAVGFRRLTELSPKSGPAWAMLGLCEYQLKQPSDARKHLQAARRLGLQQDPTIRHVAFFNEGQLLIDEGRFEDAQKVLDQLAAEKVDTPELKTALGKTVLRSRHDDAAVQQAGTAEWLAAANRTEAAAEYERLVRQFSGVDNTHYARARFLLTQRQNQNAIAAFRQQLQASPQHVLARLALADTLRATNPSQSLPYAKEAIELAPKLPLAHYVLGMCLLDNQEVEAAIPELRSAAKLLPDESRIYYGLARAYARAGRQREAAQASQTYSRLKRAQEEPSSAAFTR